MCLRLSCIAVIALAMLGTAPSRAEYVRGRLTYDDRGTPRGLADVRVEIWQFAPGPIGIWTWRVARKTFADGKGNVDAYIPYSAPNTIFALRIFPENYAAGVVNDLLGNINYYPTPERRGGGASYEVRFDTHITGSWGAMFNVIEKARHAFEYAHARRAPGETDRIQRTNFMWGSFPSPVSFFNPGYQTVQLNPDDAMNDMTIVHEYAHALEHWISTFAWITSSHDGCTMDGEDYGPTDPKHAWMEGFANYFAGAVARAYPGVIHQTAWGTGIGTMSLQSLENGLVCTLAAGTPGENVESRVSAALWDLADADRLAEPLDKVSDGERIIFEIFDNELDQRLGHWPTLIDFYNAWIARRLSIPGINRVFRQNKIEFAYVPQYPGSLMSATRGRCLDVINASTLPGTLTQIWDCWGGGNQQWKWTPVSSVTAPMVSAGSNQCLDVRYGNAAHGERTQIWPCNGGPPQLWSMPWFKLRNDRCVQPRQSGEFVGGLEIQECRDTSLQRFSMTSDGQIRNPAGQCLDLMPNTGSYPLLYMVACTGSAMQKWKIETGGFLRNGTGRCLSVASSTTGGVGSLLRMEDCPDLQQPGAGVRQRFSFEGPVVGLGGMCLDVDGTYGYSNGDRTQVWSCHYGPNQTWEYFP